MTLLRAPVWQLILADLALILFLVTLTALAGEEANHGSDRPEDEAPTDPYISQAQALYRPDPLGPSLAQWLSEQSPDPRATLTIFAQYAPDEQGAEQGSEREGVWAIAQALSDDAQGRGFGVRVVITEGKASDVYASLAYDTALPE